MASRVGRFTGVAMCVVAAGAVLAVAALPVALVGGLSINSLTADFESLPSDLKIAPSPQTTSIYARDGKTLITTFYDENRKNVALSDVAPVMRQAMVAAEDTRFYQHGAVDLKSVLRALVSDGSSGEAAQGASTLTMQYVRNVLKTDPNLTPAQRAAATEDTPGRKIQEVRYGVGLEKSMTKDQILQGYLNIAYFGNGEYGIYAASEGYFGKPPSQLTLPEAALIAGLVQSPDTDNPVDGDKAAALSRRTYVLGAMAGMHVITQAQADAASATPLDLHPSQSPNNCTAVPAAHNDWGFFCDYFRQWWNAQPAFGTTVADRERALSEGGYTVVTSLDPNIQASALHQSLSVYGYDSAKALPIAVVQPGTGQVLSLAVNRHYSLAPNPPGQQYPNTVSQLIAGGNGVNGYQAGSTFKLFTMLAGLEAGKPLSTRFDAPSPLVTQFPASGPGSCGGFWCPVNDNPSFMDGQRTMWDGYGRSVNTYFVWLEEQIGPQKAVEMAQRLGITFRASSDASLAANDASEWGSFTLGVADTTPLDLANAYATVADEGTYCKPVPVVSITDASGHKVSAGDPNCHQVLDPDIARAATDAARCPVGQQSAYGMCNGGTATNVGGIFGDRPVAGKTGSSENNATETFVGFTPQVAAAGIAADPANASDSVGSAVESSVAAAVAHTLMTAVQGLPVKKFTAPSVTIAYGPDGRPPANPPAVTPHQQPDQGDQGAPPGPGRRGHRGGSTQ
ncbi:transglycosylase domain-containing protein [Rugosimonospora africana]|uniref:Penicillin-binding protein n=1 Tax=Rugosimonospora africana TaxID=556532 RepID=A0A8J3VT47_9ACTN|nr:transglycosylase domain-containing protein [Rugosimonospora africana]GIH18042.1 penicillin-binding protein [Rugosimonospora africana]